MTYLHLVFNAVHRDLKTPNVLLSVENGKRRAKVADFGMCRFLTNNDGRQRACTGRSAVSARAMNLSRSASSLTLLTNSPVRTASSPIDLMGKSSMAAQIEVVGSSGHVRSATESQWSSPRLHSISATQDSLVADVPNTSHEMMSMTTGRGTPLWMAPEIVKSMGRRAKGQSEAKFSQAVDIYSFAIIMWECLALRQPWETSRFKWSHEVLAAVENGDRPLMSAQLIKQAPKGYVQLMRTCWDQSPQKRPRFNWVVRGIEDVRVAWHCRRSKIRSHRSAYVSHTALLPPRPSLDIFPSLDIPVPSPARPKRSNSIGIPQTS